MMQLFTIKYKPKNLNQIVGQKKAILSLLDFIRNFPKVKATILYGPPGVGKTATVYALANQYNYELVKVNSSELTKENDWKIRGIFSKSLFGNKKIILIDEVDNVKNISKIVKMVKNATIPVIMTANDAYNPRLRNLRDISKLIEFKRIRVDTIKKYLEQICKKEKIRISKEGIEKISNDSEGDLRAALNDLYVYSINKKNLESYRLTQKNIFNALRNLFNSKSIEEINIGDVDFDTLYQWVIENVQNAYDKLGTKKIFNYLSIADVFSGITNRKQYFPLEFYSKNITFIGIIASNKHKRSGFIRLHPPDRINYLFKTRKSREENLEVIKKYFSKVNCSLYKIEKYYLPFLNFWTKNL